MDVYCGIIVVLIVVVIVFELVLMVRKVELERKDFKWIGISIARIRCESIHHG